MKISYLSLSNIPSRTANSIHVIKMCNAFVLEGAKVHLFCTSDHIPRDKKLKSILKEFYGKIESFTISFSKTPKSKFSLLWYSLSSAIRSRFLFVDMVYGRDVFGCMFAIFLGLPVMIELHSPIFENKPLLKLLFKKVLKFPNFKKLIVINSYLKEYCINTYHINSKYIEVLHDGADMPSKNSKVSIKSFYNFDTSKTKIGYVGHLYEGRGVETLIELSNYCPWAEFHFVGGNETDVIRWKTRVPKKLKSRCIFHGFVNPSMCEEFRKNFDILVSPYQSKVFSGGKIDTSNWMSPLKIFEYMSSKRPIVASNLPAIRDILVNGKTAILCEPRNLKEWIAAFRELRKNNILYNDLVNNAFKTFSKKYTWRIRAKNLIKIMEIKNN